LLARGVMYAGKEDFDRAIGDYNEVIRLDPKSARAFGNRGLAYANKRDLTRAIADYEAAIRLDPNFTLARQGLEQARAALAARGPAPPPTPDVAAADRTACAKASGEEAIVACGRLIAAPASLSPAELEKAYRSRGVAYRNKGDFDRAVADFNAALQLDPRDADALTDRGVAYARKRDFDRAFGDYDDAIRLNPR